jgi:hypothetical protein
MTRIQETFSFILTAIMRILARPDEKSFDSASFSSSRAYCESLARASSFEVSIM